jgi:hypothetical protein
MSTIILACQTIKDEMEQAVKVTGISYPVILIESGLHNYPDKLRVRIQEEINRISNVSTIILGFGFCGTSLLGIKSEVARLIIPRVEDCVPLLLGSVEKRKELSREVGTYYLTKGWIEYESSLWKEYHHCLKKYGPEKTARIMKIMLNHYKRLVIINTGAYDLSKYKKETEEFSEAFGLQHLVVEGSLRYFQKLLIGPWDEEFLILQPGEEVNLDHLIAEGGENIKFTQITGGLGKKRLD